MAGGIQLHHLFMVVSDVSRSKRFYTDLLGLRVNFEEGQYVQLQGENGFHIGMEQENGLGSGEGESRSISSSISGRSGKIC